MDYKELQMFQKAIHDFLLKLRRKKQINVKYYFLKSRIMDYDFSFVGYSTKYGTHGIHYCRQKNCYYFGSHNREIKSTLQIIPLGIAYNIPSELKDAFLKATETKISCVINR